MALPLIPFPIVERVLWRLALPLILLLVFDNVRSFGQATQVPSSATALVIKSVATLSVSGTTAHDVVLEGKIAFTAGSQKENGRVRLVSDSSGNTRFELHLPSEDKVETNRLSSHAGERRAKDHKIEHTALHNSLRTAAWFFPEHYLTDTMNPNRSVLLVDSSITEHPTALCLHSYVTLDSSKGNSLVAGITGSDIYLDSTTLLPFELDIPLHPDRNAAVTIPTKITYGDYRLISGHMIPFHIQRFVNGLINMDITLHDAKIDNQTSTSEFEVK